MWLEDQDMRWMAGIQRSILPYSRSSTHVRSVFFRTKSLAEVGTVRGALWSAGDAALHRLGIELRLTLGRRFAHRACSRWNRVAHNWSQIGLWRAPTNNDDATFGDEMLAARLGRKHSVRL